MTLLRLGDHYRMQFDDRRPVAWCGDTPIAAAQLLGDVARLRRHIEAQEGDLLLLCRRRYLFAVTLLAAWSAGRQAILPPAQHAPLLAAIVAEQQIGITLDDEQATALLAADAPLAAPPLQFAAAAAGVLLYTSGSTGAPKAIAKTVGQLLVEAQMLADHLPWPDGAVVASVPPAHLYGLTFSVLMPLCRNLPFVDGTPLHAGEVVQALRECGSGTLISVPIHLRAMLEQGAELDGVFTVASAGPLPEEVAHAWQARFGNDACEIYGSSETGAIASRRQRLAPHWQPLPGVEVAVDGDGLLQIASPYVSVGDGRFASQDRAELFADGSFALLGRSDAIVKIAGRRVALPAVEQALLALPAVTDAAVVAVPASSHLRELELWAAVAGSVEARAIRAALQSRLDPLEIPRRIKVVERLPREANGKLARQQLLALFEAAA